MKARTVVLLRHGRTELNARGVMISVSDPGLDPIGEGQVREAAAALAGIEAPVLYASPLRRALQSAEIVRAELVSRGRPSGELRVDPRLRELGFGAFEGRSPASSEDPAERHLFRAWRQETPPAYPAGAETFEEAGERVASFFREEVAGRTESQIIVAHGHILRILIAVCVLEVGAARHRRLCLDHARMATLRWEGAHPRLDRLNVSTLG